MDFAPTMPCKSRFITRWAGFRNRNRPIVSARQGDFLALRPQETLTKHEHSGVTIRKTFSEILVQLSSRRMIERLPALSGIRNRRRPDGVPARQFHRSFAHLGSAPAYQPFCWLL